MAHPDPLTQVRRRIKHLRTQKSLRQEDLAEKLNWNLRYYQRFEGQTTQEAFNPKIRKLLDLAQALDVPPHELFRTPQDPTPEPAPEGNPRAESHPQGLHPAKDHP